MVIFTQQQDLITYLAKIKANDKTIGFVPTMGALHAGHTSLIEQAKKENDIVCCSVFVNPTQFNSKEDLAKYPITTKEDLKHLKNAGCDIAFFPTYEEVYGIEPKMKEYDFALLDKIMEAVHRPGHFKGMANVVSHLFNIVTPHTAYFGLKDYQQLQIIKELKQQEKHEIEVIGCPIIRETNGLAMSSRNERLSKEGRKEAAYIYQILQECKKNYPDRTIQELNSQVEKSFANNKHIQLEYFSIANANTLQEIKDKENEPAVACIAAWCEGVRLIDNLLLNG